MERWMDIFDFLANFLYLILLLIGKSFKQNETLLPKIRMSLNQTMANTWLPCQRKLLKAKLNMQDLLTMYVIY